MRWPRYPEEKILETVSVTAALKNALETCLFASEKCVRRLEAEKSRTDDEDVSYDDPTAVALESTATTIAVPASPTGQSYTFDVPFPMNVETGAERADRQGG